jgi:anti-anti-sigma factor
MNELAQVQIEARSEALVATIRGEVDLSNVEEIDAVLSEALDGRRARHVIDLSETTFIDSVAIRMLFALGELLSTRRQELLIVAPESSPVGRVLRLVALHDVIPLYADLDSALTADQLLL